MATSVQAANPEGDVKVTAEDQEMINKFARQNARLDDVTEELKQLEKDLRNFEDAADEILMAEDDVPIPYPFCLGEIFVSLDSEEAQQMIEQAKEHNKTRVAALQEDAQAIRAVMADLKSQLYGKFGSNINLEPDDS
ncbi:prefoldin subunit 4-like [Ornithodoros turicata]|uniref:prefoldin subunit 4-like n=1 Tax=Ornithodoros turicata TaxID=34597 RepID=UPI0031390D99